MITPIPIFIRDSEPDKCPKCNREEDVVEVCRHCGHEYEYVDDTRWYHVVGVLLMFLFALVVFLFVAVTIVDWLMGHETLWEVFTGKIGWLFSKKIF